tara:strand:+ start:60 stop:221 length:162 start_codon:yes stop_codon:yes gene_type:complete
MKILTMIVIGMFGISNSYADVIDSKPESYTSKVTKIIFADEKPAEEEEEPDCE